MQKKTNLKEITQLKRVASLTREYRIQQIKTKVRKFPTYEIDATTLGMYMEDFFIHLGQTGKSSKSSNLILSSLYSSSATILLCLEHFNTKMKALETFHAKNKENSELFAIHERGAFKTTERLGTPSQYL